MAKIAIKYFTLANVDILTLTTKTELFTFCRYDISLWLIYDCQLFVSLHVSVDYGTDTCTILGNTWLCKLIGIEPAMAYSKRCSCFLTQKIWFGLVILRELSVPFENEKLWNDGIKAFNCQFHARFRSLHSFLMEFWFFFALLCFFW